ncbi:MAG: apolipoprotein N-acyltransferase [Syntrophales bacterium]
MKMVLGASSGLLLFLSFPKYGNWLFAWVALIPLLYALHGVRPREGFRIGFLTGLVAYIGILYWISFVVVQYGNLPLTVGIAAMVLLASYLSLYTACFAQGIVFLGERGIPPVLSAPVLWTLLDYARAHLLTGFPWEQLAHSQYLRTAVIQIADITGTYGITFAIVFINAVLYDLASHATSRTKLHRTRVVAESAAAVALIAAILIYGHIRIGDLESLLKTARSIDVTLVQGNIDQNLKWNSQYQAQTIEIYRSLSLQRAPSRDGLIVWPETAAPFYFQQPGAMHAAVAGVAATSGAALLFGSPSYETNGSQTSYLNSAFLLKPDGTLKGRYDKVHLVPYGEYVPLRTLFPFVSKLVAGVGDFLPGRGYYPLSTGEHRLGVLICYEGILPDAARQYKRRDADVLVNITNDAWFGRTSAPYQHLSMTVFRAVENRLSLVRAANTGISAVIDPVGRIVSRTGIFERTILNGSVKIVDEKTWYAAYGDLFVYCCGVALAVLCIRTLRRRKEHAGRNF